MINTRLLALSSQTAKASLLPRQKLKCQTNSPLEYIFKNCMPEEEIVASTESINQSLSLISDKANTPFALSGNLALGVALDEMDKTYVKPLINQVNFVRNVVNPIVEELHNKVEVTLKEKEQRGAVINIKKLDIPDFLYGALGQYINSFAIVERVQKGPSFKPTFPDNLSRDQLIEMCRTSSDDVNAGIMELATIWNNSFEGDLFDTAYNELILGSNEKVGGLVQSYRNMLLSVIGFLVVDKIAKEPTKGLNLDNVNLTVWCNFFRSACARVIQSNINQIANAISGKILIHGINPDTTKKEITVYGKVYDEWESPDKIEVMVGILNTSNNIYYRSISSIVENLDKLKDRGSVILSSEVRVEKSRKISRLLDAIQGNIINLIQETIDSEETSDLRSFIPDNKMSVEYRSEINKFLNANYPGSRLLETPLRMVIAQLICKLFFHETMAGVIIQRINQLEIKNPNATPASLISNTMIDLLIEWVSGQIELVSY